MGDDVLSVLLPFALVLIPLLLLPALISCKKQRKVAKASTAVVPSAATAKTPHPAFTSNPRFGRAASEPLPGWAKNAGQYSDTRVGHIVDSGDFNLKGYDVRPPYQPRKLKTPLPITQEELLLFWRDLWMEVYKTFPRGRDVPQFSHVIDLTSTSNGDLADEIQRRRTCLQEGKPYEQPIMIVFPEDWPVQRCYGHKEYLYTCQLEMEAKMRKEEREEKRKKADKQWEERRKKREMERIESMEKKRKEEQERMAKLKEADEREDNMNTLDIAEKTFGMPKSLKMQQAESNVARIPDAL